MEKFYNKKGVKYAIIRGNGVVKLSNGESISFRKDSSGNGLLEFDDNSIKNIHSMISDDYGGTVYMYMNKKKERLITFGTYRDGGGSAKIPEYNINLSNDYNGLGRFVALFSDPNYKETDPIEDNPDEKEESLNFVIYPNPNNGKFTIQVDKLFLGVTYKIFDESGKKIFEGKIAQQKNEVSINVAAGVHAISFYRDDEIIKSHKIIVKQ